MRATKLMAAAAVCAVAFSACGADADPPPATQPSSPTLTSPPPTSPTPEETPSPAPEETPTPPDIEPPERPVEMDDDGVEGAEAAARYFIELYPYVYTTGDLTEWEAMSHPECVFCESVTVNAASLHRGGGFQTGGDITVLHSLGEEPVQGNPHHRVDLTISEAASTRLEAGGAVSEEDGGDALLIFAVTSVDGSWSIREVQVEDVSWVE